MDLLDLYHAHDLQMANEGSYETQFTEKEEDEEDSSRTENSSPEIKGKQKKTRIVPWEPYKAAVAPHKRGDACPEKLPELVAYAMNSGPEANNNNNNNSVETRKELRDARKDRKSLEPITSTSKEIELERELDLLRKELQIKQKLNSELKRLMIATLSDELQGQVEALTEDKVRLAHRVDEYMGKLRVEDEESDRIRIDRDVWKSKFLAQSIRCDELTSKNEYLLKTLVTVQNAVKTKSATSEEIRDFVQLDLQLLFNRSPCEERVQPITAKYTNLTISCCKTCTGRDIQLL